MKKLKAFIRTVGELVHLIVTHPLLLLAVVIGVAALLDQVGWKTALMCLLGFLISLWLVDRCVRAIEQLEPHEKKPEKPEPRKTVPVPAKEPEPASPSPAPETAKAAPQAEAPAAVAEGPKRQEPSPGSIVQTGTEPRKTVPVEKPEPSAPKKHHFQELFPSRVIECFAVVTPQLRELYDHIQIDGSHAYYADERGRCPISDRAFRMTLVTLEVRPYQSIETVEIDLLTGELTNVLETMRPCGYGGWGSVSSFSRRRMSFAELAAELCEDADPSLRSINSGNWRAALRNSPQVQQKLNDSAGELLKEVPAAENAEPVHCVPEEQLLRDSWLPEDLTAVEIEETFFGMNIIMTTGVTYSREDGGSLRYDFKSSSEGSERSYQLRLTELEEQWVLQQLAGLDLGGLESERNPSISYHCDITVRSSTNTTTNHVSGKPLGWGNVEKNLRGLASRRLHIC